MTLEQRMETQSAEFDACAKLAKEWRRLESAVREFLEACKVNGRP